MIFPTRAIDLKDTRNQRIHCTQSVSQSAQFFFAFVDINSIISTANENCLDYLLGCGHNSQSKWNLMRISCQRHSDDRRSEIREKICFSNQRKYRKLHCVFFSSKSNFTWLYGRDVPGCQVQPCIVFFSTYTSIRTSECLCRVILRIYI